MSLGFVKKITFHPCKKLPATQLNLMIHLLFFYVFLLSFGKIRFCPGNKVVLSNSGLPLNSNVQYRDDHTKIYHILSDSHSIPITYPIILLIPIYIYPLHTYTHDIPMRGTYFCQTCERDVSSLRLWLPKLASWVFPFFVDSVGSLWLCCWYYCMPYFGHVLGRWWQRRNWKDIRK